MKPSQISVLMLAPLTISLASLPGAVLGHDRGAGELDSTLIHSISKQMDQGILQHSTASSSYAVHSDDQGNWIVDLTPEFLAPYAHAEVIPAELDARLQRIRLELTLHQERRGSLGNIYFRFDGLPLEELYPEAKKPETKRRGGGPVFISAGHGAYYHLGWKDWRYQRDVWNGVLEDLTTLAFADELQRQFAGADAVPTALSRPLDFGTHAGSGKSWAHMASRYHAQRLLPGRADIWASYPTRNDPKTEYNDDIRTRPLWANDLTASALVHLHTNGADSAAATGLMAFYQPGRETDRLMGHAMLCAMRSAIQSVDEYRTYKVRTEPLTGNYGENRLANAPSILMELGFHTNPVDALALQDPVFQEAAMRGIREGYRTFEQLKDSDPQQKLCE